MSTDEGREQTEREKLDAAEARAVWYRTVLGETEARVRELEAENERLRTEEGRCVRCWCWCDECQCQPAWYRTVLGETEARVRELEAENAAERAHAMGWMQNAADTQSQNVRLRAENERLRETLEAEKHRTAEEAQCIAENERLRGVVSVQNRVGDEHANRLAAATALPVKARTEAEQAVLDYLAWEEDVDPFLANQPAAPARTGCPDVATCCVQGCTVKARTEAEQAVLDACSKMALDDDNREEDEDPLEPSEHGEDCYIYTDDQYAIAKAELARRGLK